MATNNSLIKNRGATLPICAIVVPCFNECKVLQQSFDALSQVLNKLITESVIHKDSFILFVDDGSTDTTWSTIVGLHEVSKKIKGLKLSRNFGHQNALYAGLMEVKDIADCTVTIDADLQQDEKAIERFVEKYRQGYEVVLGTRENRASDGLLKRTSALIFYNLMQCMGVKLKKNQADYRLLSKKALNSLAQYDEVNLFLRGLVPLLGFKTAEIKHAVRPRSIGKTKYRFAQMVSFALDGITSFSIVPMRIITFVGGVIFIFSVGMVIYVLYGYILGHTIPGWTSTVVPIYALGGVQLMSMGIMGEYIGRIYLETKRRPRFIIEEEI